MTSNLAPFAYLLPSERIAQRPVYPYDHAKLLLVNRSSGSLSDSSFSSLTDLLRNDDLLVFNNSKVVPARLFGNFEMGGGQLELLLLKKISTTNRWLAMGKPLKKFKAGVVLEFEEGLRAKVLERSGDYEVLLEFFALKPGADLEQLIRESACMPIPPYIRAGQGDAQDRSDYQTCFAQVEGSIAAPTASLHFTPELLQQIKSHGCQLEFVTLHVGQASFLPLQTDAQSGQVRPPPAEEFVPSPELAGKIIDARNRNRRIVAVGTTVVRALESMALGELSAGRADLFIKPGYKFKWVDAIITNFHQPGSTHLMLVEAFLGFELLEKTYHYALKKDYRFLSYGDGMIIC